jgi:hypothetical protein
MPALVRPPMPSLGRASEGVDAWAEPTHDESGVLGERYRLKRRASVELYRDGGMMEAASPDGIRAGRALCRTTLSG